MQQLQSSNSLCLGKKKKKSYIILAKERKKETFLFYVIQNLNKCPVGKLI